MVTSCKLYIDGQWLRVYMLTIYIIHVECDDIMLSHHLRLDVACNFTYATNGILVVHVVVTYFQLQITIPNWDFSYNDNIRYHHVHKNVMKMECRKPMEKNTYNMFKQRGGSNFRELIIFAPFFLTLVCESDTTLRLNTNPS